MLQMLRLRLAHCGKQCGPCRRPVRYGLKMKKRRFLSPLLKHATAPLMVRRRIRGSSRFCAGMLLLALGSIQPSAHAASEREPKSDRTAEPRAQQEQRRNALRSALAQRRKSDEAIEATLINRHLTAQERDEMRQQLRQQRRDAELAKP